jgi:protein O-mannosyl-transferase
MAKKSRLRKFQGQRSSEMQTGKTAPLVSSTHKPWQIAAVCLVLAVITVFAYQGVRNNGILEYDDNTYLLENQHVQQGLTEQSIDWAFTAYYASNWHPLTWISHMIDWSIYGKDPCGHHITNLCLHAANAVLLFLLMFYITGFLGRSAMVAFLFALHPAHVESVAWIAERKDILCALFWFVALIAYAWNLRKPSWKRYACVLLAYTCALMSKPMAVTLPLTLLLLDVWPLRRITFVPESSVHWLSPLGKLCLEKWPLFIMAILSSILTFMAQRSGGAVTQLQILPLWVRLSNAAISYCRYVRIAFWPHPLTAFYYHETTNISVAAAVLATIALLLVTAVCWHFRREKPYCFIGWLWFLVTLTPVIGIVQVGQQAMAERYTYIPLIGIFIAVVWLIGDAVQKFPQFKIATQLLATAVIAACAIQTHAQVIIWKDTATLFSHVIEVDPRGEIPNVTLGVAYMRQGRLAEAEELIERSLSYNPYSAQTLLFHGDVLQAQNKLDEAAKEYRKVIALDPNNSMAYDNLGIVLGKQGLPGEALKEFRQSLAINPDQASAHANSGWILTETNQLPEAVEEFTQALRYDPGNAIAHNNLGVDLLQLGNYEKAAEQFTEALQIDPTYADAKRNLSLAQAKMKM